MRRVLAPLLVLLTAAFPAWSQDLPDPREDGLEGADRLAALVERVKVEQARVDTLWAEFSQVKESSLLAEPVESTGEFFYRAPESVRWTYESPTPTEIVIDGEEMVTWYVDLGRAERVTIGSYADQIFKYLGASNSLDLLEGYFDVRVAFPDDPREPYRLELAPRFSRVARRVAGMTIWIDPDLFLPRAFRYEEPDGDVTEYRFETVAVNTALPEGVFSLDLPAEVEVRSVDLSPGR